jgi:hypothetical protein
MRDLLGGSDDLEGWRQSVCIRRLVAAVGELRLGRQAAALLSVVGSERLSQALRDTDGILYPPHEVYEVRDDVIDRA